LGHVPKPGRYVAEDKVYTATDEHIRSNGEHQPPTGKPILAVGDSFTWGDQVSDDETWPSYLERTLGKRIVNAGVAGYGVDQAVLRAEQLVEDYEPELLIGFFIPADVWRSELSYFAAPKPYFRVVAGKLELHNVPVPQRRATSTFKRVLGYSHACDWLLGRVARGWYLTETGPVSEHEQGPEVCALLTDRLAALRDRHRCKLLLVLGSGLQIIEKKPVHPRNTEDMTERMIRRAKELDIDVLNLVPRLREKIAADPSLKEKWFYGHMTPEGNAWVAAQIAERLERVLKESHDAERQQPVQNGAGR
jgi:hypothetical protein